MSDHISYKDERIELFHLEWEFREAALRSIKADEETIALHKKEILHKYSLKEEDVY